MPRNSDVTVQRVGLRDVAGAAGVCLMTASLSLRNSPKISQPTRRRVRAIAEKLGYCPDPEMARLMGRLRLSRKIRGAEVIAMFDLRMRDEIATTPYDASIRLGVTRRAEALGFAVSVFRLIDYDGDLQKKLRVVRSRGIAGIILLPSNQSPISLDRKASWDGLSVVAATTAVLSPRFHQVIPNQLYNMMTLIEKVQQKGYRRLGAILSETLEERTAHQYSLALTWHGHRERILILPRATPAPEVRTRVMAWRKEQSPDVVITAEVDLIREALRSMRRSSKVAIVSLKPPTDRALPFQDQLPELIGESAVSLVTGMMYNNETGVPAHPRITTIDGVFRVDRLPPPCVLS